MGNELESERFILRKRLSRKVEELERSNRDLEQFAYAASHDLSTPLRQIEGFTKLLEQEYGHLFDENAQKYLSFIIDGAQKSQELINGLLSFSRAGREINLEEFSLDHALDDALLILDEHICDKGVEVLREPLPFVKGDKALLTRVFQNLVGNAIKFRAEDRIPIIRISSVDLGDMWRIAVSDNGAGMDMRHAERIFVIFQRLPSSKNGSGVGLSLCKRIVERHQGRIWVESTVGEGSTFFFTLPKEYVNGNGNAEHPSGTAG